jgi:hypothetical protein
MNDHTDNNEHDAPPNLGIGPLAGLAAGALAGLALGALVDWLHYHPPKDEET